MPFTLAHPAIVVPLAKHWPRAFSLTALVVGSMSPDFEYFVWLEPRRTIGHEAWGVPLLCVPTGLVVLYVFDRVIKRPLIAVAPRGLRRRLSNCWRFERLWPKHDLLRVLVSMTLGGYSHLVWDALTHADGWFVRRISWLNLEFTIPGGRALAVHTALQHLCSVLGLALILLWSYRWLRTQPVNVITQAETFSPLCRVISWIALLLVPAALGAFFSAGIAHGNAESRIADTTIATIAAWCCVALIFGVIATMSWRAESPRMTARVGASTACEGFGIARKQQDLDSSS